MDMGFPGFCVYNVFFYHVFILDIMTPRLSEYWPWIRNKCNTINGSAKSKAEHSAGAESEQEK